MLVFTREREQPLPNQIKKHEETKQWQPVILTGYLSIDFLLVTSYLRLMQQQTLNRIRPTMLMVRLYDIENIVGSDVGNDEIGGNDDANKIVGWGGDDTIYGYKRNDTLHGGYGKDTIYGNMGDDIIWGQGNVKVTSTIYRILLVTIRFGVHGETILS
ncbi:MAG: hypothetical protein F6K22_29840 [Okeania sp. SIO2F4]|uniref:hypothetical protein n=1 Tax=Okeania sp. SIO2F4 TaxID=2607790 RepID=UPI00142AE5B1|nr:hypothetical protein [Okeania sp. SIO2F4]NES06653.1 hypothetical protein [Okeania sp. SIO2F4]